MSWRLLPTSIIDIHFPLLWNSRKTYPPSTLIFEQRNVYMYVNFRIPLPTFLGFTYPPCHINNYKKETIFLAFLTTNLRKKKTSREQQGIRLNEQCSITEWETTWNDISPCFHVQLSQRSAWWYRCLSIYSAWWWMTRWPPVIFLMNNAIRRTMFLLLSSSRNAVPSGSFSYKYQTTP